MSNHRTTPSGARRAALVAVAVALCALGPWAGAVAQSGAPPDAAASLQPATATGEPIPLTSLGDLTSLDATVTITADGTMNGKRMQGDLTATLTSNDQHMSQIDITGSLLGPVAAQVGGKLVGLFRPDRASVYTVPDGTYVVVSGLTDICVKPGDNVATEALDQFSPKTLMTALTDSDVARGTFVGDEMLNGAPVRHYVIDGPAFLAAAQAASTDPTVRSFAQSLRTASDADLYLAADTGYPVSYVGSFSGAYEPLGLDGDFTVRIDLTAVDANTPVTLPGACDHPISR